MRIFDEAGEGCTTETIKLAVARGEELNIEKIVVASSRGGTALRVAEAWPATRVVAVRYVTGFEKPNLQDMMPETEKRLRDRGVRVVTAAHAMGGIGRAVRRKLNTVQVDEIIAHTLRIFGQGVKVACEVTLMACDAGAVRTDEKAIALGGSGRGCDAALVLTPANTHDFFNLRVHEIICKPAG